MRFLLLLKDGSFEIVPCPPEAVAELINVKKAGICGVFNDFAEAEEYLARIASGGGVTDTFSGPGCGLPTITKH